MSAVAPVATEETTHHHLPVSEVLLILGTEPTRGLDQAEVERRQERFGPNALPREGGPSRLRLFLSQFNHPLIYVLLVAAAVTAALGETIDSSVIIGVVLINALVGYIQEARADAALRALAEMARSTARVLRSGRVLPVDAEELVPGDLVVLEAGDRVPADLRLVDVQDFTVDESMLTGESVPVGKHSLAIPGETALADRANMAYSGTLAIRGQARGVVVATGVQTEIGRIQRLVGEAQGVQTPLTRKLGVFSRWLTIVICILAVVTFGVGLLRGESVGYMVTAAVALAVGAIPEGLPAAVTITLAIGVNRMARRNAIIRHLPAVEALGSTTVVCTDKTGTLTRNEMTVVSIDANGTAVELEGDGPRALDARAGPFSPDPVAACLAAASLCNNASLVVQEGHVTTAGDPTEVALLVAAHRAGVPLAELEREWPRTDEVPFETANRYMATLHRAPSAYDEPGLLLVKGAAERILPLCSQQLGRDGEPTDLVAEETLERVAELAAQALRVLAVARGPADPGADPESLFEAGGLTLLGLTCMIDPARPEARTSVARCREAGIAVKMITGDHPRTGAAIGAAVGLAEAPGAPRVVTGPDIDDVDDSALPELIARTDVFARVTAEQKLRIVLALQSRGEVAAMTGDGVNDAPALKQADIGIAMGQTGSEVAKESADMVLTDDNFATIEAAVEEGRGVFDNLTKYISWALPTSLGEGLIIIAAIAVAAELPITPVQILWINMTTAVALGLTLAFEPGEATLMSRPPRDPRQPILTRVLVGRIVLVALVMLVAGFWLFDSTLAAGHPINEARTVAVNAFVVIETAYLFNSRTLTKPAGSVGWFSNRWLLLGVTVMAVLQVLYTYLPAMNTLFGSAPLTWAQWTPILLTGLLTFAIVEVEKAIRNRASGP
jgi:cation-transporting ATPase F